MPLICLLHLLVLLISTDAKSTHLHRIINGVPININQAPWQVSLQTPLGHHFCGGSILSSKYILTAAHCLIDTSANEIKVRVGSKYVHKGGRLIAVASIKNHNFNSATMTNDVAILKLKERIKYDRTTRKIKLAEKMPRNGKVAYVSGWGTTVAGGNKNPRQLMMAAVKLIDRKTCQATSEYSLVGMKLTSGMICAANNGKDACQGDSGGPLVSDNKLVGIVSWGQGCAIEKYPGVYTDVAYFRNWTLKQIGKNPNGRLNSSQEP